MGTAIYPPEIDLQIEVNTDESCKVLITDISEYSGYTGNNTTYINGYSNFITFDLIQINKSLEPELSAPIVTEHYDQDCPIILPIDFDGWFKIYHIVMPTKECIDENKTYLSRETTFYYSDGEQIFKFRDGQETVTDIYEIMERNTEGTSIYRVSQDFFSICNLRKCYINLCNKIFDSMNTQSRCWDKGSVDSNLRFKRDMLWMAINVITYLVQNCRFSEAQSLLERLDTCNGLCDDVSYAGSSKSGCGCHK